MTLWGTRYPRQVLQEQASVALALQATQDPRWGQLMVSLVRSVPPIMNQQQIEAAIRQLARG